MGDAMMADTVLVGTRKGLIVFSRQATGWRRESEHFVGVQATYVGVDRRHNTVWACLNHGHWGVKLHRSADLGTTWDECDVPTFGWGTEITPGKAASVSYLWTLQPGGADQPQRLYLGTIPGGLFVSDDGGSSWALNEPLWHHPSRKLWFGGGMDDAGIHSVIVDPQDSRHVWVGVSAAGIFETVDDGAKWTSRNQGLRADFLPDPYAEIGHDPHFVVGCPGEPHVLWQQNHCGIFSSQDGGGQWQNVSQLEGPAKFGFAVAVDPHDAQTAWVIPAVSDEHRVAVDRALCVCRTTDGGASWTRFHEGLPQQDCYDFAFRHALDVSGDRLAFGTAGGSCYVSDDRGENWTCLGSHLAPVYSVRFV